MFDATPDAVATDRQCRACELRLDQLPIAARFCPRCGEPLRVREPLAESSPAPQRLRRRFESLRTFLREHLGEEHQNADGALALDEIHSLMLLGYSNAMLQLAWHYEKGSGVARNSYEAERCYCKSARLGNPYALAWLADREIRLTPIEHEPVVPAIDARRCDESR
jgi:hypothetical protein